MDPKTVQRRVRGGASKSSRSPTNRALHCEQEQAIKDSIERLDDQNVSAKVSMIRAAANYILAKSHSDPLITPPQVSEIGPDDTLIAIHSSTKRNKSRWQSSARMRTMRTSLRIIL